MPEVLFEFVKLGNSVRVTALDVKSGTEAITVVPANISQEQMKQAALKKLKFLLEKEK